MRFQTFIFGLIIVAMTTVLVGCGRKGPLYLQFNNPPDAHTTNPYVPHYQKNPPSQPSVPAAKLQHAPLPPLDNQHVPSTT